MTAAAPGIRVEGLRKRFGAQEVLRGVDLEVAPSELMVVIGRSGGACTASASASAASPP